MLVPAPSPEYAGPAAHIMHDSSGHPLSNTPPTRVVIHSTVSPCVAGGRYDIARYFRSPASGGCAHYVVDPAGEVQVVWDGEVAEHAPPNQYSLGIEMCDMPVAVPSGAPHAGHAPMGGWSRWKALKRSWRWVRPEQQAMLKRTARLTAQLCLHNNIPIKFLTSADLLAGKHGITTHNNVSQAWHQTTHWDPGFWPQRRFMRLVHKYAHEFEQQYGAAA